MHVTVVIHVELVPTLVFGAIRMHIAAAKSAAGRPSLVHLATVQPKLDFTSAQLVSTRVRHFPVAHPEIQCAVSAAGTDRCPFRSPKGARREHRDNPPYPPHSAHDNSLGHGRLCRKARHAP